MPPRKEDPLRHCDHCGKRLRRERFDGRLEDLGAFARRRYCDRACMAAGFEGRPTTLDPARRTLHERARKAKGLGPCEECGCDGPVDVHHRDGNRENNNPANLDRLCRSCHLGRHRGARGRWGAPSTDAQGVAMRGREGGSTAELTGDQAPALRGSSGGGSRAHALIEEPEAAGTVSAHYAKGFTSTLEDGQVVGVRDGGQKDDATVLDTYNQNQVGGDVTNTIARTPTTALLDPATGDAFEEGAASGWDFPPDGRRYAACGDGVAAPVAHWIGLRIIGHGMADGS